MHAAHSVCMFWYKVREIKYLQIRKSKMHIVQKGTKVKCHKQESYGHFYVS